MSFNKKKNYDESVGSRFEDIRKESDSSIIVNLLELIENLELNEPISYN